MKYLASIFFLLLVCGTAQAADEIKSAIQNPDGSWSFSFIFDNGNDITGQTWVVLPAPVGTPAVLDAIGNVVTPAVDAVPYTSVTAKDAVLPLAAAQKAQWEAQLGLASISGSVTLP